MEEDIKVLEERINFCKNNKECREELKQCFGCTFEVEEIQAIENLIKRDKKLEEMLKHRIKYTNELEKNLFENASNYVIPKSKVREKIEELEAMSISADIYYDDILKIFKELLQEGDDK